MEDIYIAERRNQILKQKERVYKLISDCYVGGYVFKAGNHLFQYSREQTAAYKKRTERAIYINHVQPLADMMVGFLYGDEPERVYPNVIEDFMSQAWKGREFNTAMQYVAVNSLLYTVGILVDSPQFDPDEIMTEADRQAAGLHPYMTIYYPWQIRDFSFSSRGELLWVLLDDSEMDATDPYAKPVEKTQYKLWTPEYYQMFTVNEDEKGKKTVTEGDMIPHPCGKVPFVMANWKDIEMDFISDSVFEDIAYMSRTIFNYFSYMDEILASSAFKSLFFPVKDVEHDIPKIVQQKGFAESALIPFRGDLSGVPFFAAPEAGDIARYLDMMTFLGKEILRKVGLDKDEDKVGVQSGEAKRREFRKAAALLQMGARVLEQVETEVIKIACKWMGLSDPEVSVKYSMDFDDEDIESKLKRLQAALEIPIVEVQNRVYSILLKTALKEDIEKTELDKLMKQIMGLKELAGQNIKDDLDSYFGNDTDQNNTAKPGADKTGTQDKNPDKTEE